ncbi:MAG: WD40 repeat domain-containing protein [Pseudonocardiaceae bacterium]
MAVNPAGTTFAIAGDDGAVALYDLATAAPRDTLPTGSPLHTVAFHPTDGSLVAGGAERALYLWDHERRRHTLSVNGHGRIHDVTFDQDGRRLYCACARTTMVWDMATGTRQANLGTRTGPVFAVASRPDAGMVASAGADGAVLLWDRAQLPLQRHTNGIPGLAASPDGRTLASASMDHTIAVWNTRDHSVRTTLTGHTGAVNAIAYHHDGHLLASGGDDNTVRLWDPRGATPPTVLRGHTDQVRAVAFHPRQRLVASGGDDGRVLLWALDDPADPTEILPPGHPVHTKTRVLITTSRTWSTATPRGASSSPERSGREGLPGRGARHTAVCRRIGADARDGSVVPRVVPWHDRV